MKENSMTKANQTSSGFTALISAIIISAILLIITVNTGIIGYYGNVNSLNSEIKEASSSLADSCLDIAILKLNQYQSYNGNTTVQVNENTCYIGSVTVNDSKITFNIKGVYRDAHTNMKVVVDANSLQVLKIEEILTL